MRCGTTAWRTVIDLPLVCLGVIHKFPKAIHRNGGWHKNHRWHIHQHRDGIQSFDGVEAQIFVKKLVDREVVGGRQQDGVTVCR